MTHSLSGSQSIPDSAHTYWMKLVLNQIYVNHRFWLWLARRWIWQCPLQHYSTTRPLTHSLTTSRPPRYTRAPIDRSDFPDCKLGLVITAVLKFLFLMPKALFGRSTPFDLTRTRSCSDAAKLWVSLWIELRLLSFKYTSIRPNILERSLFYSRSSILVQMAGVDGGRRVSRASSSGLTLTDFLQRRSLADARGSLFQTLNRRPSRPGTPIFRFLTFIWNKSVDRIYFWECYNTKSYIYHVSVQLNFLLLQFAIYNFFQPCLDCT